MGVVEHPQPVAQPRADVQIDHAGLSSCLSVTLGDSHHRDFLKPQDVLQPVVGDHRVGQRQLGRTWVAEHIADASRGQHLEHDLGAVHGRSENGSQGQ